MFLIAFIAIIGVYFAVAIGITYWLTRLGKTTRAKWTIAGASLFVFLGLAVGDEVWGYVYLRNLCAAEGGIKVYKTVTLGPEHWNLDGSPKFIVFKSDAIFKPFLEGRYQFNLTGQSIAHWPRISRSEYAVVDLGSKEQLAQYVTFFADQGWLVRSPGWHVNRRSCSPRADVDRKLISAVFRARGSN